MKMSPGFRHTRESGYPGPSSPWIPFFNGMTDAVRHLDSRVRGNDASSRPPRRESHPFSFSVDERKLIKHFVVIVFVINVQHSICR
jgi:hypothetical protein